MSAVVRVGIIGTGFGAKAHIPGFRSVPGVEVVAIAGTDRRRTEAFAQELHVSKAHTSWEALIEDRSITAVSVATPPSLHYAPVMAAVKRGMHVLCEKPFGLNPQQAAEMLSAATDAGIVHMVDFSFRMAPERKRLKQLLESGKIGKTRRVNVEWTLRGRADRTLPSGWQFDPALGGGVLFAFGSHVVDYIEWLLGPIQAVSAHLSTRSLMSNKSSERVLGEDSVDAMMLLRDGTPVSVSLSTVTPGGRGHWLSIYGETGALVVGTSNLADVVIGTRLYRTGPDGNELREIESAPLPPVDGASTDGRVALFSQMAWTLVDSIRTGRFCDPTFRSGWRAQVVMEAIRDSNVWRKWVDIAA